MKRCVIGITGASGSVYGIRLTEELLSRRYSVELLITDYGRKVLDEEVKGWTERIKGAVINSDASISGSFPFEFMVVAPCTLNTLAKISLGISDTKVARAAQVCIKEGRPLILLVREMPWTPQAFLNAYLLERIGVRVVPASPAFYSKPKGIEDIINFVVGRILDLLGIDNELYRRWKGAGGVP